METEDEKAPELQILEDNTAARAERREWELSRQKAHRDEEAVLRAREDARVRKATESNKVPLLGGSSA